MAPARKHRRPPPELIEQGIGLLEALLPKDPDDESPLPPGQRDPCGFWFPAGYLEPGDIFTAAQRQLQAKQRQVQRRRHRAPLSAPRNGAVAMPEPMEPGGGLSTGFGLGDTELPLPAPERE